mmetsp:Transcript_5618/g.12744  ORF Transcript_5618/g.12744 Transcript_5618/m.12744 type:complete len:283 (+) Transcript_5618:125-973(+)
MPSGSTSCSLASDVCCRWIAHPRLLCPFWSRLLLHRVALGRRVGRLTMLFQVQVAVVVLWWDDGHEEIDPFEQHDCHHKGVGCTEHGCNDLLAQLLPGACHCVRADAIAWVLQPITRSTLTAIGKNSQENRADEAAHAVHAPDIQGVVKASTFHELAKHVAAGARDDADDESTPGLDETCCRCHSGQASDRTHAEPHQGGPPTLEPIDHQPEEERHGGCDFRVYRRSHRSAAAGQGRAAVKAKPAEPQKSGAEGNEGHVVGNTQIFALLCHAFPHHCKARQR